LGDSVKASGYAATAMGYQTTASGDYASIAMGFQSVASGVASTAMGENTIASSEAATAMGYKTLASGWFSTAMGDVTSASGNYSTAMGEGTIAEGNYSTAMGYITDAYGEGSTAMGHATNASGGYSTAMGEATTAFGPFSTAMGHGTRASGYGATAMGYNTIASGDNSIAMGVKTTASGGNSTAIGVQASTNGHANSFCIGGKTDVTSNPLTLNTEDNQMMMRFDNYTFWVSPANFAYLIPASNGWAYTSDINKKEKFEELNGETVLNRISDIPFYSWNFKDPSCSQYRHYGIMAQDFYNAFGKDSYGNIGNDTTVSPLDLLGVAYSAIKELDKRSTALAKENEQLKSENLAVEKKLFDIQNQFADKLALLETKMNEMLTLKEKKTAKKNALSTIK
jgi:hypothetical protein